MIRLRTLIVIISTVEVREKTRSLQRLISSALDNNSMHNIRAAGDDASERETVALIKLAPAPAEGDKKSVREPGDCFLIWSATGATILDAAVKSSSCSGPVLGENSRIEETTGFRVVDSTSGTEKRY